MNFTKTFSQITKNDAPIAGGKGASLGEMTNAGISVPPGFVVLADAFEQFLKETDLDVEIDSVLHAVNHQEMHTVEHASEKIQALILEAKMPEDIAAEIEKEFQKLGAQFVAVRSSATAEDSSSAAWAGQLDSFLNTTEETLLENLKKCWASLFTPRAIFYRFEQGLHTQKISVAVVVQKMVQSEISGIAFSVHPVTEDPNQLIIEAGYGLGEAIVSGQITPDSYVVEKEPQRIIDINVSEQTKALHRKEGVPSTNSGQANEWRMVPYSKQKAQVLTEAQILELSELIVKIENHYGFPCDIEWAFEGGKFYITQSRPITTLKQKEVSSSFPKNNKIFEKFKEIMKDSGIEKQEGNFGPFAVSMVIGGLWPEYMLKYYDKGFRPFVCTAQNDHGAIFFSLEDYRYFTRQAYRKFLEREEENMAEFQEFKKLNVLIPSFYEKHSPDVLLHFSGEELMRALGQTVVLMNRLIACTVFSEGLDNEVISEIYQKAGGKMDEIDIFLKEGSMFDFSSFVERFDSAVLNHGKDRYAIQWLFATYWNVITLDRVENEIQKAIMEKGGIEKMQTEIEDVRENVKKNKKERIVYEEKMPSSIAPLFRFMNFCAFIRDERKRVFLMCLTIGYNISHEMFQRKDISDENLTFALSHELSSGEWQDGVMYGKLLSDRKQGAIVYWDEKETLFELDNDGIETKKFFMLASGLFDNAVVSEFRGHTASAGTAKGRAVVVMNEKEFWKFNNNDVVVTSMTRPEFVPILKSCSAIITDEGGITCHAAIISRELKKPCIIGTKIATQVLHDGDLVEVDADNGVVRVLERVKRD